MNLPKIVSLVPSWTETLIAAGVNVVGRTRFCIHPSQIVKDIAVVGGTKSIDLEKIKRLNPDFVLVDKQENTKEMAEQLQASSFKLLITDVVDFSSVILSCRELGQQLKCEKLIQFADRYQKVISDFSNERVSTFIEKSLLKGQFSFSTKDSYAYVIWRNPFMVVGDSTFIGENFKLVGIQFGVSEKYPEISPDILKNKFCFFSSEPYPFSKHYEDLVRDGYNGVVLDGEKISWFGIRNLQFLESCLGLGEF